MPAIDEAVSAAPPTVRALLAVATISAAAFSMGMVVGAWGMRDDIDGLRSIVAANTADIATGRSETASLRLLIEQSDLRTMSSRVARMDRELCLMRADQAGSITLQMQQECASR
jgi:hypothetical protein